MAELFVAANNGVLKILQYSSGSVIVGSSISSKIPALAKSSKNRGVIGIYMEMKVPDKVDFTLDCYGLTCPMPIFNASQKIKEMAVGEVLEVVATDEGIVKDMPGWCEKTGNEFLGAITDDDEHHVFIRKAGNPAS